LRNAVYQIHTHELRVTSTHECLQLVTINVTFGGIYKNINQYTEIFKTQVFTLNQLLYSN